MSDFDNQQEKDSNIKNDVIPTSENKQITYGKVTSKDNTSGIQSFLIGMLGGVLGCGIVLAVVFNIPNIKTNLLYNEEANENDVPATVIKNMVEYQNPIPAVASTAGSSVVGISVEYTYNSFFGQQRLSQEGSGIIISSDGYIITNNHVVSTDAGVENTVVKVYLSNSTEPLEATIVGTDQQTDIAVLKVDCTDLPAVKMGSSIDLEVGAMVVAIGNPLGRQFAGSITVGYVSALNRKLSDSYGNSYVLIQTDAAINEGNSGGALVNTNGELIGINVAKIEGTGVEGLGFAIPIDDVKTIINDLIEYKKVIRPTIGIQGVNVDEATKNRYNLDSVGVYIKYIEQFSAAEKAGLKIADIIVKVQGEAVTSVEELNEVKNKYKVGDTITLDIIRDGKEKKVEVTLKEQ